MAGLFKKIAKWALIGGGSVLSLIPGIGAAIGAPLIVAGSAINTGSNAGSADVVAAYAGQLQTTLQTAGAMQAAGTAPNLNIAFNSVVAFLQKNIVLIIAGIGALIILPKLIGRRRR